MVDDQHESEAEEPRPSVDEAMSDASGDTAKTPSEDDPTSEGGGAPASTGTVGDDDPTSDAVSDMVKSPDAEDDAV